MIVKGYTMNAQELLDAYINTPGIDGDKYWESLSDAVGQLVHKAAGKRETGDLDDFEEECILSIWGKINSLKASDGVGGIDNLEAFVRQAVHNRYCDAIRRKRPKWYNLKLELLEIFSGKANVEGFAIWQNPEFSGKLCGYSEWEGSSKSFASRCRELLDNSGEFRKKLLQNRDPQELPTYELAAAILDYCNGPVEIDVLTNCVAELTQTKNLEPLSIDALPNDDEESNSPIDWLVSSDTSVEKQVVDASWFNHVIDWFWREFAELSIKQKKTLLYGMAPDQVMALVSSVGMKEVANSLEINAGQLASLINELPLADAKTADELGIQARAVPSVRFKAWGRIRRRTRKSSLAIDDDYAAD